ncbi:MULTISPECIES: DUF6035 family protein [Pseudomonas]|uniref:DUF6035 family protein n=1 Tax=Pseudomonas TaxID=286 RepID=UPI001239EC77|nr:MULTISPECIES: DUF6035 family protein [Pseudomonas]QIB51421.1 hypothetical protein G3M63_10420 [Pseudomonas sp. OIL-1]
MNGCIVEPAQTQEHEMVLDRDTGRWLSLLEFMGGEDYGSVISERRVALRIQLIEGQSRYVCPKCENAMILASIKIRDRAVERFFFKHLRDDGSCTGLGGSGAKAIDARRFAQAKEGHEHKQLKGMLLESLAADASFSETMSEKRWWDIDGVSWRQPDVRSCRNGLRVAFEVQLSTTFLHVIAERMAFYRRNEGRLLWLFRDLELDLFRLSEDDIFYANNRNAFRITRETVQLSQVNKRFALECMWLEPVLAGTEIVERIGRSIVYFDQLTFDNSYAGVPRAYFFDYESARSATQAKLYTIQLHEHDASLRKDFNRFYLSFLAEQIHGEEFDRTWSDFMVRFFQRGILLPDRPVRSDGLHFYLVAAYSARAGMPVGTRHTDLVKVGHYLVDQRKRTIWLFRLMLEAHDRAATMKIHDPKKNWLAKAKGYRAALKRGDEKYMPNRDFDPLLSFLFPEVAHKLILHPKDVLGIPT